MKKLMLLIASIFVAGNMAYAAGGYCQCGLPDDVAGTGKSTSHHKISICHVPPGNEENIQTIEIDLSAWKTHQRHGDYVGTCEASRPCSCSDGTTGIWIELDKAKSTPGATIDDDRSYRELQGK